MRVLAAASHAGTAALASDPSIGGSLIRMVLALAVVVAVIYLATKVLVALRAGRLPGIRPAAAPTAAGLSVVSRQSLGKGLQVAVVRWGEREVLVGIAGQTITFLNDPARDEAGASEEPVPASGAVPFAANGSFPAPSGSFPAPRGSVPIPAARERGQSSLIERLRDATARSI